MGKRSLLITGSTGFVGSNFIKTYQDEYRIETFSLLRDDIENFQITGIDTVLHLGALVHQMGGASRDAYEKSNVEDTIALAAKAKRSGVGHFIFMSSIKVYGDERAAPYLEESPCLPQDDYGRSKLEAEQKLLLLADEGFTVSIIRTPVVYGKGVKANILNLIKLVNKFPLLPLGGIDNRRSMVYVGNLNHLVDTVIKKRRGGIFLACDDEPFSTSELIALIAKALNKRVFLFKMPCLETVLKKFKPSFYKRLFASLEIDNSRTIKDLDYKNRYSKEEAIKLMVEGMKE